MELLLILVIGCYLFLLWWQAYLSFKESMKVHIKLDKIIEISEQSEKAIRGKGYCPKCNAKIQEYDISRCYENSIEGYPFECDKCGFKGVELYHQVFVAYVKDDFKGKRPLKYE